MKTLITLILLFITISLNAIDGCGKIVPVADSTGKITWVYTTLCELDSANIIKATIDTLDCNSVTVDSLDTKIIDLDVNYEESTHYAGRIHWDKDNKTVAVDMQVADVQQQLGQELYSVICVNKTGTTIYNGMAVFWYGAQGNRPKVWIASADSMQYIHRPIGFMTHDCLPNQECYVTIKGAVNELKTSDADTVGATVYLLDTVDAYNRNWSYHYPPYPAKEIVLGSVEKKHNTQGSINVDLYYNEQYRTYWDDVKTDAIHTTGTTEATFTRGVAGNAFIGAYYFQGAVQNDILSYNLQMPHKVHFLDTVSFHFHGFPTTTPAATDSVRFQVTLFEAEIGQVIHAVVTDTITIQLNGVAQWQHQYIECFMDATGTGNSVSKFYLAGIRRLQTEDSYTQNYGILGFDCHAKMDAGGGSRQEYIK